MATNAPILNNEPKAIRLQLEIVSASEIVIRAIGGRAAEWCADFADRAFFSNESNVSLIGEGRQKDFCLSSRLGRCIFRVNEKASAFIVKFFDAYWQSNSFRYTTAALNGHSFTCGLRITKIA